MSVFFCWSDRTYLFNLDTFSHFVYCSSLHRTRLFSVQGGFCGPRLGFSWIQPFCGRRPGSFGGRTSRRCWKERPRVRRQRLLTSQQAPSASLSAQSARPCGSRASTSKPASGPTGGPSQLAGEISVPDRERLGNGRPSRSNSRTNCMRRSGQSSCRRPSAAPRNTSITHAKTAVDALCSISGCRHSKNAEISRGPAVLPQRGSQHPSPRRPPARTGGMRNRRRPSRRKEAGSA